MRRLAPLPHHEGQAGEFFVMENVDRGAVGGDDGHHAVPLPQAIGLAFDDFDDQASGEELAHGDIFHQRHGEKLAPDVIHVEEGQRLAGVHPGDVEDLLVAQFDLSRDGHGVEAKAQRPGDQIARLAIFADESVVLAADLGADEIRQTR